MSGFIVHVAGCFFAAACIWACGRIAWREAEAAWECYWRDHERINLHNTFPEYHETPANKRGTRAM